VICTLAGADQSGASMDFGASVKTPSAAASARQLSRIGGGLYLFIIVAGLFAEAYVRERLIVPNDAAATAGNIQAQQFLFRLGVVADLSTFVCAVPLAVILYSLLRSVNRNVALLMLALNIVQDAIGGLNALNTYSSLQLASGAEYLRAFSPEQLHTLVLLSLKHQSVGFAVALVFFGCSCIALGYLIYHSRRLPRILGMLMAVAGVCYLINSSALLLSPPLAALLFPPILYPAFVGELSLALWLAVRGVATPTSDDVRES
jgi:hypothetical protein